ncbi:MAG: DNA-binding protein [Acholeplasmataceae bacterium]|nr:DNA-binding protein [Acholeplasmataceae bacterium]
MESLEKKEQLNELFDMYQKLLTDKQVQYFKYYYQDDYSLQEIAELSDVSRNAVFDQLKKVEMHLFSYEEKLQLLTNKQKRLKIIDQLEETKDLKKLDDLRKLEE